MSEPQNPSGAPRPAIPFAPVPVRRRRDGWTADKQIAFIDALGETGCVLHAAACVGMSARSAYQLAARPGARAFAEAWDCALSMAARPLTQLALRYATEGMVETIWKDGEIVGERRRPSERLLIFLLSRLDPARFGSRAPPFSEADLPRSYPRRRLTELVEDFVDMPADEDDDAEAPEQAPPPAVSRARAR